jgi:hypothetical protein
VLGIAGGSLGRAIAARRMVGMWRIRMWCDAFSHILLLAR